MAVKLSDDDGGSVMLEATAGSIGELIDQTKRVAETWVPNVVDPQELWFRGQPRAHFPLAPGLFRPHVLRLHYDEVALFERFKVFATPYLRRSPSEDWEWYFLAQHYGLPTRLLDWTESLLAAAYFAVCDAILCKDRLSVDDDLGRGRKASLFDLESPVVWILDAGTLNRAVCEDDCPFFPGGELTAKYLPEALHQKPTDDNKLPLAILPPRTNDRITAQQGVFTVHGHDMVPLEALAASSHPLQPINLARVLLDRANLSHFWDELQLAGVTKLGLFPGVDTAAAHVQWIMQSARMPKASPEGR